MELFSGNGEAVRQHLLHNGCYVTPFDKYRPLLNVYLQTTAPDHDERVTCSDMTGWHGSQFIMPNKRIGSGEELILYQGTAEAVTGTGGTLEGWQDTTAKYCIGNSRLLLAVCAGLAAPLLHICGLEGGGIHFKGRPVWAKQQRCMWAAPYGAVMSIKDNGGQPSTAWRG
jgi:putative DNA primase/helicase